MNSEKTLQSSAKKVEKSRDGARADKDDGDVDGARAADEHGDGEGHKREGPQTKPGEREPGEKMQGVLVQRQGEAQKRGEGDGDKASSYEN